MRGRLYYIDTDELEDHLGYAYSATLPHLYKRLHLPKIRGWDKWVSLLAVF